MIRTIWTSLLLALMLPGVVRGQDDAGDPASVRVSLASAGVGGVVRPGDWAGLQIELSDNGDVQREILLEVRGWDADGDTPLYQRAIASNPGRPQRAWVYLRLPHSLRQGDFVRISAYEAVEGDGPTGFVPGALLARELVPFGAVLDQGVGALLTIGRAPGGLRSYTERGTGSQGVPRTSGHEPTEIWGGLTPLELPDRWTGLSPFEVVVWSDARVGDLTSDRASALLAWVERGGHLVIGPRSGTPEWFDPTRNPLGAALPRVTPREIDATLADLLLVGAAERAPRGLRINAFDGDGEDGTVPVLLAQDGSAVVVRRSYGLGMVTLTGIDLANSTLADRGLPRADSFWHRVLGWRGRAAATQADGDGEQGIFRTREIAYLDADVRSQIGKSGPAAAGVLLGLVTFLIYLAMAGPVGFLILKKMKQVKHAWTLYIVTAIVFTGIAWGGAQALRPGDVEVRHLTYLDSVSGVDLQRTRTWASVLLPSYGEATVETLGGVIAPWEPPIGAGSVFGAAFPDVRAYAVDGRASSAIEVPIRSTVKQVRADWLGDQSWGTIDAVSADGLGQGELSIDTAGRPVGTLSHSLPGPLEDVIVLVNRGQLTLASNAGERFNAAAWVYQLSGPFASWAPGRALDLAEVTRGSDQGAATADTYFRELARDRGLLSSLTEDASDLQNAPDRLAAASWITQFAPPEEAGTQNSSTLAALRRETWGLDLGRWLTQPCIIVIGQVTEAPSLATPIAVRLGGGELVPEDVSGRTVVRWVYPLPPNPPRWPARLTEDEQASQTSAENDSEDNGDE